MKILQYPNPLLRQKCTEVEDMNEARKIISKLITSLNKSEKDGIGLSAPQIGITKRIYIAKKIIYQGEKEEHLDIAFINPTIIKGSKDKGESLEGCLSISDTYGYVIRHKKITVEYTDLSGNIKKLRTGGYLSYVIQHEQDHLDGVLFIDKLIDKKTYTEKQIDQKIQEENKY